MRLAKRYEETFATDKRAFHGEKKLCLKTSWDIQISVAPELAKKTNKYSFKTSRNAIKCEKIKRSISRETENDNFALNKKFFILFATINFIIITHFSSAFKLSKKLRSSAIKIPRCRLRQKREINIHYFIMRHQHDTKPMVLMKGFWKRSK